MKRLLFTIACLLSFTLAATAKSARSFPGRNLIPIYFETLDEKTSYSNLEKEGIATTYTLTKEELPGAVLKSLNKKYKGYLVQEIVVYENNQSTSSLNSKIASNSVDKMYFVHLKNDSKEFVIRITPTGSIYFFKKI